MMAVAGLIALLLSADPRTASAGAALRGAGAPGVPFRLLDPSSTRAGRANGGEEAPQPAPDDRDRERILRLQSALRDIVHVAFGRLKVGLRVIEAQTGRVFFGRGTTALMDPASNQKVLATTTALMRLGGDWRFRTEVYGPLPDADGVVHGDLYVRGSGDPTLSVRELEELANQLFARGITRITGGVIADPRRFGDDRGASSNDQPGQMAINRGIIAVRVRPGPVGEAPSVIIDPPPPADPSGAPSDFLISNRARSVDGRQRRLAIEISATKGVVRVDVAGRIGADNPGVLYRRRVPDGTLAAAIFFRAALAGAGISVRERATVGPVPMDADLLVAHASPPLSLLLRKINKDSDNYEAERLLEAVGAEVLGGAPTTEKGIAVLRDVIGEFGLDPRSYVPKNGSGLGHANRISAEAMTELLRALYLDPRVGPELVQSLSVGGIDGTTRNRFRGTPVARHVRAKTGTLVGKSVLSGLVGDGSDVMAFSIMVQGFKTRSALTAVRGAQVAAVNMMMRYVQERGGARVEAPVPMDLGAGGTDYETGGEMETEDDLPQESAIVSDRRAAPADHRAVPADGRARPVAPARRLARAPDATAVKKAGEGRTLGDVDGKDFGVDGGSDETEEIEGAPGGAHLDVRLGVGGAGSIAGGDAAPGGHLFLDFGGEGLGIETAFYGTSFHALGGPPPGNTEWTRFAGAIGPRYRISNGALAFDVKAAIAAGWFWVEGHNYATNSNSKTWALGAQAGARVSWQRGALSPWLGLDAVAWPGRHDIQVVGIADTRSIPALDLLLSLGASFRIW